MRVEEGCEPVHVRGPAEGRPQRSRVELELAEARAQSTLCSARVHMTVECTCVPSVDQASTAGHQPPFLSNT